MPMVKQLLTTVVLPQTHIWSRNWTALAGLHLHLELKVRAVLMQHDVPPVCSRCRIVRGNRDAEVTPEQVLLTKTTYRG
ncbi:hypothetical protein PG994_003972 [Apiospora phragmitis]|uniref:Secreted protein n=1 Tax=Apiospora phragmitis TaxID=2905665 RepID=A0ABR1W2K3_9PEZI